MNASFETSITRRPSTLPPAFTWALGHDDFAETASQAMALDDEEFVTTYPVPLDFAPAIPAALLDVARRAPKVDFADTVPSRPMDFTDTISDLLDSALSTSVTGFDALPGFLSSIVFETRYPTLGYTAQLSDSGGVIHLALVSGADEEAGQVLSELCRAFSLGTARLVCHGPDSWVRLVSHPGEPEGRRASVFSNTGTWLRLNVALALTRRDTRRPAVAVFLQNSALAMRAAKCISLGTLDIEQPQPLDSKETQFRKSFRSHLDTVRASPPETQAGNSGPGRKSS